MNETIENDLRQWIDSITTSNPDLSGFSICPFAKNNTYKIIKTSIHDIKPLNEEFGVVIFVVEDDLDLEFAHKRINQLNQEYPKYKFFDDFRDEPSFINSIQTNNGKYNLILYQNSEFLQKMRIMLAKTTYYDHWDDDYLKIILEKDYKLVQKIRNK
jgi:predicted MPP superfamily phosphohydrolase